MTFKKEISIDGILTLLGVVGAVAMFYSRVTMLESNSERHDKHFEKIDSVIEQQSKIQAENTTKLNILVHKEFPELLR